jgi:hypothetical protein
MVRLKALTIPEILSRHRTFQFQYGSIKSRIFAVTDTDHVYFNSNMVRLKVFHWRLMIQLLGHFNSNMVRLKACIIQNFINPINNFNSNMVRLKAHYFEL